MTDISESELRRRIQEGPPFRVGETVEVDQATLGSLREEPGSPGTLRSLIGQRLTVSEVRSFGALRFAEVPWLEGSAGTLSTSGGCREHLLPEVWPPQVQWDQGGPSAGLGGFRGDDSPCGRDRVLRDHDDVAGHRRHVVGIIVADAGVG